jgi:hypothetical protein
VIADFDVPTFTQLCGSVVGRAESYARAVGRGPHIKNTRRFSSVDLRAIYDVTEPPRSVGGVQPPL